MGAGIPYVPLDVKLDTKFALIEAEFGIKGFGVIVKILQEIYGEEGYYIEWTNEVELLFAQKNGLGGGFVSEIVQASIKRGIFDKRIFDKYGVLTSHGIQERYMKGTRRRLNIKLKSNYLLLSAAEIPKNVDIITENVDILNKNVDISEQCNVMECNEMECNENYHDKDNDIDNISAEECIRYVEERYGRKLAAEERQRIEDMAAEFGWNDTLRIFKKRLG